MIVSKTPLRVSLFGGGTDFPEYFNRKKAFIIGGTINKYIYISINKFYSRLFDHKIRLFYKNTEFVKNNNFIKHLVINKIFKKYKIFKDIELHIASDLPSNSGLGSSSAFTCGLLNLVNFLKKKKIPKKKLALLTI
jgi:D-glycero-alpha-D-manno-heptose-7-phosphate kinase